MNKSKLKVGDVVMLNSGGPRMTVEGLDSGSDGESAACCWFQPDGTVESAAFSPKCLIKVST